jgi:galactose oxidase
VRNSGRWYPTTTTLPDGSVLVTSGSFQAAGGATPNNQVPQVWSNGTWTSIGSLPNGATFELFPRMHLTSAGEVFMSGPLSQTWSLSPANGGRWAAVGQRDQARRDYAPSVMYGLDKVVYIGGGNDPGTQQPTAAAEVIDLRAAAPAWHPTNPMHFPRRQHNATILADGTVLVTGGSRGGGGPGNPSGFNDLGAGQPVHTAELWDPATGQWTELAAELVDRCYHATAVLLPDATVVSAGGGEYRPAKTPAPNDPADSHRDAQVFSPPYLFKGPRPVITSAPASVNHGDTFEVATAQAADIAKVTFIRLSSVTHSCNMNQHINVLAFQAKPGALTISAPASPNECPPGHYLLFVVSKQGGPSVAAIVRMQGSAAAAAVPTAGAGPATEAAAGAAAPMDALAAQAAVIAAQEGRPVVVGLLGTCPYGLGACWGGAHEALATLEGVRAVDPIPDANNSTADVYLEDDRLPPLRRWQEQFGRVVNGSYTLRGVEVTVQGSLAAVGGDLFVDGEGRRPRVLLGPLGASDTVQWNSATASPRVPDPREANAYQTLAAQPSSLSAGQQVTVTGPLEETDAGYLLKVRVFSI